MNTKPFELTTGSGGVPVVKIHTPWSTAEIYPHGATVTAFQKNGEPPLLFLSRKSHFVADKPIRGGVPICFPWFGPHDGKPVHGFARLAEWELTETTVAPDGSVRLNFLLPETVLVAAGGPVAKVNFIVTVSDRLAMELLVVNSMAQDFVFEGCLHTYFSVGDIAQVSIVGLNGVHYLDKIDRFTRKLESADAIRIDAAVDRVYLDTRSTVEIHDAKLRRKISVEKSGSASTVVWNPWSAWAKATPDFGDEEFREMVCVESGNVAENKITLAPGATSAMKVIVGSRAG